MTRKMGSNPADGSTRRVRHAACALVAFLVMGQALAQEERRVFIGVASCLPPDTPGLTARRSDRFPHATTITGGCPARSVTAGQGTNRHHLHFGASGLPHHIRGGITWAPALGAGLRRRRLPFPPPKPRAARRSARDWPPGSWARAVHRANGLRPRVWTIPIPARRSPDRRTRQRTTSWWSPPLDASRRTMRRSR